MEFGFTREQESLRKEVRAFFADELPEDYSPGPGMSQELQSFYLQLQRKAGEKGYLTPGWSKDIGGLGLGPIEQEITREEWGNAGVTWPNTIGLGMSGPAVHMFGTEEQKKKFLPGMAKGEAIWFQAFTEPDAGSDEANQQTRAVEDGDYFVLNGQKTFISGAYEPSYLYTLARTADTVPKHRGISLFLVPADLARITFRPLPGMAGSPQNEMFFDDVRVPREYLLGELNRGFYHAMATFEFERGGAHNLPALKRSLEEFVQFCKEERRNGKPLIEDPDVRKILAWRAVELEVIRLTGWFSTWWFSKSEELGPQPPTLPIWLYIKMFSARWAKETMDVLGLHGQLRRGSKWAKLTGQMERQWQTARSWHAGGTMEVLKNVLAQRGLGLPRYPRPQPRS